MSSRCCSCSRSRRKHWDQLFYVGFASRIMIYALAATSLNLILGYGGMVSFGHAAFLGAGAYTVGDPDGATAWAAPG